MRTTKQGRNRRDEKRAKPRAASGRVAGVTAIERREAGAAPVDRLARLSRAVARAEGWVAGALVGAVFLLLVANVVSRAVGAPLIWSDELAVLLMSCGAFIGASCGLAHRQHIAVTLVTEMLPRTGRRWFALAVDAALIAFFCAFSVILWNWFDPVALARYGNVADFSAGTFNFLYQEPTTTLGVRKIWFWLVLPVFCLAGLLHLAAQTAADIRALTAGR